MAKTYFFVFVAVWMRATLPRVRVDQLMGMAWKVLLPLATLNILVTAVIWALSCGVGVRTGVGVGVVVGVVVGALAGPGSTLDNDWHSAPIERPLRERYRLARGLEGRAAHLGDLPGAPGRDSDDPHDDEAGCTTRDGESRPRRQILRRAGLRPRRGPRGA